MRSGLSIERPVCYGFLMRTLPARFMALFLLGSLVACVSTPRSLDSELDTLASWMTGSFDTFAQVEKDEREQGQTSYRHIRAVMHIVPVAIPGLAVDGARTFYVEQAAASALDKPYRQRVYLLTRKDGRLVNRIYKFKDAAPFSGAFSDPARLASLKPELLTLEEGCDVFWTASSPDLYKGSTGENSCRSSWRGGSHAVSRIEMTPASITSLDQGFDDEGNQKWGPPAGEEGHIFVKRNSR